MRLVYRGPSRLTGDPIICIVTGTTRPSRNRATGPMAQTWVLRDDIPPIDAVQGAADTAICPASCPLRAARGAPRTCYVTLHQAPTTIYNARRTALAQTPAELAREHVRRGIPLRITAYGDPAAVPLRIWAPIVRRCTFTAYTHGWRRLDPDRWGWCMASVHTPAEAELAAARGWRTFRTGSVALPGETRCPKSLPEPSTCIACGMCDGRRDAPNIHCPPHGAAHRHVPTGEGPR